jgi:hypothetical protein
MKTGKRISLITSKVAAGIAALVFLFLPLSTWMRIFIFAGSIVVFAISLILSNYINENESNDDADVDYWPGSHDGPIP